MDMRSPFILLSVLIGFAAATTCSNGKCSSDVLSIYIYNIHVEIYIILLPYIDGQGMGGNT